MSVKSNSPNQDKRVVEERRTTKRYIQRVVEQQEAEEEIEDYTNGSDADRQHGLRPQRRERGSRKLS